MKITDSYQIRSSPTARRKTGSAGVSGTEFESLLTAAEAGDASASSAATGATPVATIDGVLAMQSVTEDQGNRRAAIQEGFTMLDSLEKLRSALLTGIVPPEVILELDQRLVRQKALVSDPKLLEIIEEIELRVAVERAKLEKAVASMGSPETSVIG